jgi:GNAT superfamily N-acetyltransferase
MSGAAPADSSQSESALRRWSVRRASESDATAVAAGVRALLGELGAPLPSEQEMLEATRSLLADPEAGVAFVGEAAEGIVGLVTASWQLAIHIPGRYGLVQDLWVERGWRGMALGAEIIEHLMEHARELGIKRIEVGLPKPDFPGLPATAAFYAANGFVPLGARMRRLMP